MRVSMLLCTLIAALPGASAARACDPVVTECLPAVVAFPAYTPERLRVGTVEARVEPPPRLEVSRFTGRPRTVLYNNPRSFPGAVDPVLAFVELPRVRPFSTRAVYPRGY